MGSETSVLCLLGALLNLGQIKIADGIEHDVFQFRIASITASKKQILHGISEGVISVVQGRCGHIPTVAVLPVSFRRWQSFSEALLVEFWAIILRIPTA